MNIKRLSQIIRYKLINFIIKTFTPYFYNDLKKLHSNGLIGYLNIGSRVPRPSTLFMRNYFNKSIKLKGVEIGVHQGTNSKSILKVLNIEKLTLIDTWSNYDNIDKIWSDCDINYKMVKKMFFKDNRIIIKKEFSNIAVKDFKNKSLDFVYIDGNHNYNYILSDLINWSKKVKRNGIIAGHDVINIKDVHLAVKDFCKDLNYKYIIDRPDFYIILNNLA